MSRTKKGGKAPGFDYWSKRPNSQSPPGRVSKDITHRMERQENKKVAREANYVE